MLLLDLNDHGIFDLVVHINDNFDQEEDDVGEDDPLPVCTVTNSAAMEMFNKCLIWLRGQPEASVTNTSMLVQLKELAAQKGRRVVNR